MLVRLDASQPLNRQIFRTLRRAILEGDLAPGSRLPSSRGLAAELAVSRNVVLMAYDQLMAEGYTEARVGAGTFVASPLPESMLRVEARGEAVLPSPLPPTLSRYGARALAQKPPDLGPDRPPRYDFRYGDVVPEPRFLAVWKRLLARRAARPDLNYGPPAGHPDLRRAIAAYVRRSRGLRCSPRQVVVVSGSQQALDLAARALLDPGDRVLIEEPHYQGARWAFLAAGARLIPGPVDGDGLDLEAVSPGRRDVRLVYITPSHQFPTGAVLPLRRRLALLEWAASHGAYILEDDYDSEYRYQGRPLEAVQALDGHGRTLYISTFSKVLFPALRLGFLVLPPELVDAFSAAKWLADRHSSALEQAALADLIQRGDFERHLRRMRKRHAARRAALLEALERYLPGRAEPAGTEAGVHLLVWLPGLEPRALNGVIARAAQAEVGVYSVAPYYLEPPPRAGLLLGYANMSENEIQEGIRRFAVVLQTA